jgi:transposase-like protein
VEKTPWAVICLASHELGKPCNNGERIYLTKKEYMKQLSNPDARWKCPKCGYDASFDDENFQDFEKFPLT